MQWNRTFQFTCWSAPLSKRCHSYFSFSMLKLQNQRKTIDLKQRVATEIFLMKVLWWRSAQMLTHMLLHPTESHPYLCGITSQSSNQQNLVSIAFLFLILPLDLDRSIFFQFHFSKKWKFHLSKRVKLIVCSVFISFKKWKNFVKKSEIMYLFSAIFGNVCNM